MRIFKKYKPKENNKGKPFIQPKLNFGKSGDKYEVEADAMANNVVSQLNSKDTIKKKEDTDEKVQQKTLAATISPLVQKQSESSEEETLQTQCSDCQTEDQIQRQEEEEESLQMQTEQPGNAPMNIESSLKNSKGSGSKLPKPVRQTMESSFGVDFSEVNIHTGNHAVKMSKQIKAQAFTHGNDIYFNSGKYNPSSNPGKHLLAHELTHTIQQKGIKNKPIQKLSYGSGAAPHSDYSTVPNNEKGRIDKAMATVKKL